VTSEALEALEALQSPCVLCPRRCGARRADGERGVCGAGTEAVVASYGAHFGEEEILVGRGGSGTIFLSGCNLRCAFCQNSDISMSVIGRETPAEKLAELMLALERGACENVNFVTPTHHAPQVAAAVVAARKMGFAKPVVYNCGGYEGLEALRLLDGVVDIYMPDAKFMSNEASRRYLDAEDYPERMQEALVEMHRQVGTLVVRGGVAARGLLVRHLVMPGHAEDSRKVIDFLAQQIGPGTYVNVMGQYRPRHRAAEFSEINRATDWAEVAALMKYAMERGLRVDD
jgi:putative pyruvate formate lyase activating enzyme